MKKLRVIQWTTGKIGKFALRAILDDPRLELVGVYAYSDDKVGVDAGKLCDRPDCGVKATNDISALIALKADTVVYTPFMADLSHAVKLLESGLDLVSTNLFRNVGGIIGDTKDQLAAACQRGGSSLYLTGINPGWVNSMLALLTTPCHRVDYVALTECADCATYESAETWLAMGMSLREVSPKALETARAWLVPFRDAVQRMADALQIKIDDFELNVEYATASEKIDLGWFCMEKGTTAAIRGGYHGKVKGRTVIQSNIVWYLTKKLNEGWDIDEDQYHFVVEGRPNLSARVRFSAPDDWSNGHWDSTTSLPAVNAIFGVHDARPGILGVTDVNIPAVPMGLWPRTRP